MMNVNEERKKKELRVGDLRKRMGNDFFDVFFFVISSLAYYITKLKSATYSIGILKSMDN